MHSVRFSERAIRELAGAVTWYEGNREGLGLQFKQAIDNKIGLIGQFPKRYPKRKRNFRETPLKRFPYLIVYSFYENEGAIVINSIFHTSRQPSKKYKAK